MTIKNDDTKKNLGKPEATANIEVSVDDQLKATELEFKKLQLIDLRNRVDADLQKRAEVIRVLKEQQRAIDEANRQIISEQASCKHKKGGKGLHGILNGNDANFAVIKHTYPWGQGEVTCTRCDKQVREPLGLNFGHVAKDHVAPDVVPIGKVYTHPSSKEFKEAMKLYQEWLDLPTDNEASGTQIFKFERVA